MRIGKKIQLIREYFKDSEGLFSKEHNISINTLKRYEKGLSKPSYAFLNSVCTEHTYFTLWLMADEKYLDLPQGEQTSPIIAVKDRKQRHDNLDASVFTADEEWKI